MTEYVTEDTSQQHQTTAGPCAGYGHEAISSCDRCGIRRLALCAALDSEHIAELERISSFKRMEPGQCLIVEGDLGDDAYNILAGGVKLYKSLPDGRRQITGFLLPGDFLGLPSRGHYAYSAEAILPTQLCRLPRRELETVFERNPEIEKRFLGLVKDELTAAQDHMLLLGRKSARERIACFLLEFSRRAQRLGWSVDPLILPMHRTDIADYRGLTVETVSRTFSRLREQGVVELPKSDRVVLAQHGVLEELCEGI